MDRTLHATRRPDLTVSGGAMGINARVTAALGIRPGDVIDLAVDGVECYLYIRRRAADTHGRHAATARPTSKCVHRCRNMRVHSKRLADRLRTLCRREGRLSLLAGDPVHLAALGTEGVPIITRNPI